MKTIRINNISEIPKNFTGAIIINYENVDFDCIFYYKDGKPHNENGAAISYPSGEEHYFLDGENIILPRDIEDDDIPNFLKSYNKIKNF